MDAVRSFKPIANGNSRLIILGTMPGVESLKKNQYYGNTRNQFWRIIYAIFKSEYESSYDERCAFLLNHNIALWDVLDSCDRVGSLDSAIKKGKPNDIPELLSKHTNIGHVFFNGNTAQSLFKKWFGVTLPSKEFHVLPSTSPAYTIGFEKKLIRWRDILKALENTAYTGL